MDILSSGSPTSTTIRFNVGGKIYEVSRSLLKQHPDTMLARLASETWFNGSNDHYNTGINDDNNDDGANRCSDSGDDSNGKKKNIDTALFIDRNGERFQYCLDYMRDGGVVSLPQTTSKNALLQDLAYYGFHDVDSSKISVADSISMYKSCVDDIDSFLREVRKERSLLEIAEHCLYSYKKNASLRIDLPESSWREAARRMREDESSRKKFNAILKKIGLKLKNKDDYHVLHLSFI